MFVNLTPSLTFQHSLIGTTTRSITIKNKTLNIVGLHLSDVMPSVENNAIIPNVVMLSSTYIYPETT
jgi:hypothetical protein